MIQVIPLGISSGVPTRDRGVSAIAVSWEHRWWLLDCGDGTQQRAIRAGLSLHHLAGVLITHLHGDHVLGLPAILSTLGLQGRSAGLEIYGPTGLREMLSSTLRLTQVRMGFEASVYEVQPGPVREDVGLSVSCGLLHHRIEAFGYRFEIRAKNRSVRVITYCTDTRPCRGSVELARGADLLIHEATYSHELADKADERGHSTALQAARIAAEAEVGHLILTHFSPRYRNLERLVDEARTVFPRVSAAREGRPFVLQQRRQMAA